MDSDGAVYVYDFELDMAYKEERYIAHSNNNLLLNITRITQNLSILCKEVF